MVRRSLCVVAAVVVGTTALPAQEFLWAGLARTVALGTTGDAFEDGYLLEVGIAWAVTGRDDLTVQAGAIYGGNRLKGAGGTVDVMGLMVGVGYAPIRSTIVEPYAIAGVGYVKRSDFGSGRGDPGYYAGGGLHGRIGDVAGWWLEARYLGAGTSGERLELLPITLGLTFPLKRR